MRFRLLAIFLIFLVASCAAPEEKQFVDLLITNAHVVDVREGSVLRDQTIALQDGRILHVGDDSKNYDSESKINAKGKYLIPGLWDMHVHFRGGQDLIQENKNLLPLFLANGITTVRDAGGDITNSVQIWSAEIKKGNLDGPRIFTSGPKLDGIDPTWAGSIELEKTEDVANALDSLESIGADYVKIYDSKISRDVYLEIIRQAEGRGMLTTGHMPFTVKLEEAIEAGLDATEHAYYVFKGASPKEDSLTNLAIQGWDSGKPVSFGRQLQLYYDSYDNLKAAELFSKMAETGTSILPTLYIGRVLSRLKEDKHIRDPELNYIGPEIRKTYLRRLNSALRAPDESTAFGQKLSEKFIDMIPLMHEAGVNILAGSDCGPYNTFIYPGFSLHSELQLLVEAGIPVKDVLRIATLSGPEFMKVDNDYGTIESGKVADMVLLNSNPLEDITNAKDISSVIHGSKFYSREQLNGMLRDLLEN